MARNGKAGRKSKGAGKMKGGRKFKDGCNIGGRGMTMARTGRKIRPMRSKKKKLKAKLTTRKMTAGARTGRASLKMNASKLTIVSAIVSRSLNLSRMMTSVTTGTNQTGRRHFPERRKKQCRFSFQRCHRQHRHHLRASSSERFSSSACTCAAWENDGKPLLLSCRFALSDMCQHAVAGALCQRRTAELAGVSPRLKHPTVVTVP